MSSIQIRRNRAREDVIEKHLWEKDVKPMAYRLIEYADDDGVGYSYDDTEENYRVQSGANRTEEGPLPRRWARFR